MSDTSRTGTGTVKVLSIAGDDLAVWSVAVRPDFGVGRLCGAWMHVDDADVRTLLDREWVHVVDDSPIPTGVDCQILDLEATRQCLNDEIDRLVAANRASKTDKGNRRASLQPPAVPPIPTERTPMLGVAATEPAAVAAIFDARYLASLADTWLAIETLRSGREYLRGDVPEPRPFPCAAG